MQNTLIYLLGFSGTGKYTIGQEIARRTGASLIDNQLINGPILAAVQADGVTPLSGEVWNAVAVVREAVYASMQLFAPVEASFVLTNDLVAHDARDWDIYHAVQQLAEARKAKFLPVVLRCDREELLCRVREPARRDMRKTINAAHLNERLTREEVFTPTHPHLFELDVTHISPETAAEKIRKKVEEL